MTALAAVLLVALIVPAPGYVPLGRLWPLVLAVAVVALTLTGGLWAARRGDRRR